MPPAESVLLWSASLVAAFVPLYWAARKVERVITMPDKLETHIEETAEFQTNILSVALTGVALYKDYIRRSGGELSPEAERQVAKLQGLEDG